MPSFSVIIPVYNRPYEINELLESLSKQVSDDFEVIVVEDGSSVKCDEIVKRYVGPLDISYIYQENAGPGKARNTGAARAASDFFIFFDSDCLIPAWYFEHVKNRLSKNDVDAFGGPDKAHATFSGVQKAINYSMTSFFTTGGIRGNRKKLDIFYPRSFNMGISRKAFEDCSGFSDMRFGEDLDLSMRLKEEGFVSVLIPEAFVFHKRRTSFSQFFKQIYNSGIARIHLYKRHPGSLKPVHFLPSLFLIYLVITILAARNASWLLIPLVIFTLGIAIHALYTTKNLRTAFLAVIASYVQLTAYGLGFLGAFIKRILLNKKEYAAFKHTLYN